MGHGLGHAAVVQVVPGFAAAVGTQILSCQQHLRPQGSAARGGAGIAEGAALAAERSTVPGGGDLRGVLHIPLGR